MSELERNSWSERLRQQIIGYASERVQGIFPTLATLVLSWVLTFLGLFTPAFFTVSAFLFISFVLILFRRYALSYITLGLLLALVTGLTVSSDYIIASDGDTAHYGRVNGISYLELPENVASVLPKAIVDQRLISIISCAGTKVAKLPLLPFTPIEADKDFFDSPFAFRRFFPFRFDQLRHSSKQDRPT
jgi:hypothetical protein